MTERERWIVYPLLFLALGASLRDKLFDRTTSRSIVCQELTVLDEEPMPNRPSRILARIGRADSAGGAPPRGILMVNGEVEVVDDLARGPQSAPVILAKLGPAMPVRGLAPGGLLAINGQLDVQGIVNARQYAYQGMPIVPTLRGVLPGVAWPDFLESLRQSMQSQQPDGAPQAAPPKSEPREPAPPANHSPANEGEAPSRGPRDGESPPAEPLAERAESR